MAAQHASKAMANLRTVLVKVSPAPATLSERRAILRILKQRGEVDLFKKLHDPSHFISMVETPEMARGLIERSPLQFDYVPQQSRGNGVANSPTTAVSANKTFLVKIIEKSEYKHKTHIKESLTYGRWPEHDTLFLEDSLPKGALRQACPRDMAHNGMTDWESCGQLDEGDALSTWLSQKGDFVQARHARKQRQSAFESLLDIHSAKHGGKGREGWAGRAGVGSRPAAESTPGSV